MGARVIRRDIVVVGAGPAGSMAAREIARAGASVLLVDRSVFPRGKVCGACLNAGALQILASVGLGHVPERLGAELLDTLVLSSRNRSARLPLAGSRAVSRRAFDHALVDAARAQSAEFWSGARATLGEVRRDHRLVLVTRDGGAVTVAARVVLDATGLGWGLAAPDTPAPRVAKDSRIGLGATFIDDAYPVRPGELHMVVGRSGYVGIVRVESGVLNVAAAIDPAALRGGRPHRVITALLSSVGLRPLPDRAHEEWRGTPSLTRSAADFGGERLLRLGDAAGYVEPFTGEGMCWALSGATAVAPLALAGAARWEDELLDQWRSYQGAALRMSRRLCRLLVPALRRPWMVGGALALLDAMPGLATPFVRRAARAPALLRMHAT